MDRYSLDQSFTICSLEEQKQRYSSSLHRRLIWLKPHTVRISPQLPELATDF